MHIEIPHKLSLQRALSKAKDALQQARPQLQSRSEVSNIEDHWEGNTLHFSGIVGGQSISGTLDVTDTSYILDITLPLMMRLFEGRIQKMIEDQIKTNIG